MITPTETAGEPVKSVFWGGPSPPPQVAAYMLAVGLHQDENQADLALVSV